MPNADIKIREAQDSDLPAIVALNAALIQEDAGQRDPSVNADWSKANGDAFFQAHFSADDHLCLIAVINAEAIGYLVGYISGPSDFRPVKSAEIESVFVKPSYRSQQIGRALIDQFLDWAKLQGSQRVVVTAYATNTQAIAFYENAGFRPNNVTLLYEIDS